MKNFIYHPVAKKITGLLANKMAYKLAERYQGRKISKSISELDVFYNLPFSQQKRIQQSNLAEMIDFVNSEVPYYRDLFFSHQISKSKILRDINYINDFPYLTKNLIREHKHRLLSKPLNDVKHFECKTGGSTGPSCSIFYDQAAADYSSAVTKYARQTAGKSFYHSELHFACKFHSSEQEKIWQKETLKCIVLNRSNIFFNQIDDDALQIIFDKLKIRKPYLVHGHPSTMYQLALFLEKKGISMKLFSRFEPSGEYCTEMMIKKIKSVFGCELNNRYGLAEFGVVAYQLDHKADRLRVFNSEVFCELAGDNEIVITGLRNRLMPLIRYKSGDLASTLIEETGTFLESIVGRIHDTVVIGDRKLLTHYIQDVLDHKVGGITFFQLIEQVDGIVFNIIEDDVEDRERIEQSILEFFPDAIGVKFISWDQIVHHGRHQKYRHLVKL